MKKQPGYQHKERAHFDKLAAETGGIWWGSATEAGKLRLQRRAHMATDLVTERDDPRVLEVGCGTGAFSQAVLGLAPRLRLVGCDISPVSVQVAQRTCEAYGRAEFHVADVTDMQYPPESFDAVIGNSVLHHLPAESVLAQCHRVLRPGGVLWFSEPNMLNPQIAVEKNVRFIGKLLQNTEDETAFFHWQMSHMLRDAGFARVDVTPFDFLHPAVPPALIDVVDRFGRACERTPGLRQIAGSLTIKAYR